MPRCGQGRRPGRCRSMRWVSHPHDAKNFTPNESQQSLNKIVLKIYELEALRLVDLEDLTQEEAAAMMGVSRKTLWNDLQKARKKVINALVNGYQIRIQGDEHIQRNEEEVNEEMPGRDGTGPLGQGPVGGYGRGRRGRGVGPGGDCICSNCGHREPHQLAVPCYSRKCPKCGAPMARA